MSALKSSSYQLAGFICDEELGFFNPALEKLARTRRLIIAGRIMLAAKSIKLDSNIKKDILAKFFPYKACSLLPRKIGPRYTYGELEISVWKELLTCPLGIPDEDLPLIIEVMQKIPNYRHDGEFGLGRLFFVASWSLSAAQLHRLATYLQQEEISFEELQTWQDFLASRENPGPDTRLTVRYIGTRVVSTSNPLPHTNYQIMYEDFSNPFCGVLPEFLEGIHTALPEVATDVQIHIIPDLFTSKFEANAEFWDELSYQTLLMSFDLKSLINREGEPRSIPSHMPKVDFDSPKAVYNGSSLDMRSDCVGHLRNELQRISQHMYQPPQSKIYWNKLPHMLPMGGHRGLIRQAIPFEPQGGRPPLIFVVKGIPPGDLMANKMYLQGWITEVLVMKFLIEQVILRGEARRFCPNIVPFYCFAPWYRRLDPGNNEEYTEQLWDYVRVARPMVLVTLGKAMALAAKQVCHPDRDQRPDPNQSYEMKIGWAGVATIHASSRSMTTSFSFIHVPLIDPARYKYTSMKAHREALLCHMSYSLQYAVLVADTAKRFREEIHSTGLGWDEDSAGFCREVIAQTDNRLRSQWGESLMEGMQRAKALLADLVARQPDIFR
ncbi:hypothetical protein F4814DRAFT_456142 [Daldinia grandis]|nr:hypothetical protein F4814DRAFT_456142 [Daldinia grandis]